MLIGSALRILVYRFWCLGLLMEGFFCKAGMGMGLRSRCLYFGGNAM